MFTVKNFLVCFKCDCGGAKECVLIRLVRCNFSQGQKLAIREVAPLGGMVLVTLNLMPEIQVSGKLPPAAADHAKSTAEILKKNRSHQVDFRSS